MRLRDTMRAARLVAELALAHAAITILAGAVLLVVVTLPELAWLWLGG